MPSRPSKEARRRMRTGLFVCLMLLANCVSLSVKQREAAVEARKAAVDQRNSAVEQRKQGMLIGRLY